MWDHWQIASIKMKLSFVAHGWYPEILLRGQSCAADFSPLRLGGLRPKGFVCWSTVDLGSSKNITVKNKFLHYWLLGIEFDSKPIIKKCLPFFASYLFGVKNSHLCLHGFKDYKKALYILLCAYTYGSCSIYECVMYNGWIFFMYKVFNDLTSVQNLYFHVHIGPFIFCESAYCTLTSLHKWMSEYLYVKLFYQNVLSLGHDIKVIQLSSLVLFDRGSNTLRA